METKDNKDKESKVEKEPYPKAEVTKTQSQLLYQNRQKNEQHPMDQQQQQQQRGQYKSRMRQPRDRFRKPRGDQKTFTLGDLGAFKDLLKTTKGDDVDSEKKEEKEEGWKPKFNDNIKVPSQLPRQGGNQQRFNQTRTSDQTPMPSQIRNQNRFQQQDRGYNNQNQGRYQPPQSQRNYNDQGYQRRDPPQQFNQRDQNQYGNYSQRGMPQNTQFQGKPGEGGGFQRRDQRQPYQDRGQGRPQYGGYRPQQGGFRPGGQQQPRQDGDNKGQAQPPPPPPKAPMTPAELQELKRSFRVRKIENKQKKRKVVLRKAEKFISSNVRNHTQFNYAFKCEMRFFDASANLNVDAFKGIYNRDIYYHDPDIKEVLARAHESGIDKMIIKGRTYIDVEECLKLANLNKNYYTSIGLHPNFTRPDLHPKQWTLEDHRKKLQQFIDSCGDKCIAIGETGLDYSKIRDEKNTEQTKAEQKEFFKLHIELAEKNKLPMMFVTRDAEEDFQQIIKENRSRFKYGMVQSFTSAGEVVEKYIELDLFFGITGCSMRDEDQIETIKKIPLQRIILSSNSPWCNISDSYASSKYVKTEFRKFSRVTPFPFRPIIPQHKFVKGYQVYGRNEPCNVKRVIEALAGIKEVPEDEVANVVYQNTLNFFGLTMEGCKIQAEA